MQSAFAFVEPTTTSWLVAHPLLRYPVLTLCGCTQSMRGNAHGELSEQGAPFPGIAPCIRLVFIVLLLVQRLDQGIDVALPPSGGTRAELDCGGVAAVFHTLPPSRARDWNFCEDAGEPEKGVTGLGRVLQISFGSHECFRSGSTISESKRRKSTGRIQRAAPCPPNWTFLDRFAILHRLSHEKGRILWIRLLKAPSRNDGAFAFLDLLEHVWVSLGQKKVGDIRLSWTFVQGCAKNIFDCSIARSDQRLGPGVRSASRPTKRSTSRFRVRQTQLVQVVSPPLHHGPALLQKLGSVVRATETVFD